MSLGIAFKGPEGIVLAADSRVTLMAIAQQQGPQVAPTGPALQVQIPVTYDNATKLLRVQGQDHVGAVTYGVGAIGVASPRTAHSYVPEFEASLAEGRLSVNDFAVKLSEFFLGRWNAEMPPVNPPGNDMVFLVGGYNDGEPYGHVYDFYIPSRPTPVEQQENSFGMVWGGQREYTDRLIQGFDERVPLLVQQKLGLNDQQRDELREHLRQLQAPIPYPFLPLQDCVDLAVFLIRTTIKLHTWIVDVRGVGGAIDVATVTRTDGLSLVQQKSIHGES